MSDNGGDREVVLGNRQLLAIFFVAALLCGVFFAVGYVVGGNSAKSGIGTASADATGAPVAEGKREQPSATSDAGSSPAAPLSSLPDAGGQNPAAEPRMADNPTAAGSTPPAAAAQSYQAAPQASPPPVSAPPASAPATKAPNVSPASASTGIFVSIPEKGASYVQVSATERPRADDLVKSLREAKMPSILAESSKPDYFKVLVGPYRAPQALADAKRKLTELGFNGLIVYKP